MACDDSVIEALVNVYGSKNLWPTKNVSTTINGVTFTVNNDGTISTSGTSTGWTYFDIIADSNEVKTLLEKLDNSISYKLNGTPSNASGSINIVIWNNGEVARCFAGQDTEFTKPSSISSTNTVYRVGTDYTNVNFDGLVFRPMIRAASVSDNTYVPYTMTNRELTENRINNLKFIGTYHFDKAFNGTVTIAELMNQCYSDLADRFNALASDEFIRINFIKPYSGYTSGLCPQIKKMYHTLPTSIVSFAIGAGSSNVVDIFLGVLSSSSSFRRASNSMTWSDISSNKPSSGSCGIEYELYKRIEV